jgi:hypothetical protein
MDAGGREGGNLLVRRYQAAVSMRLGAGLAGAKLALLSGLGATGWTADRQRLLFGDLHATSCNFVGPQDAHF